MLKCFVIAPIGNEGSEIRKRSDQVFKYIIDPVCRECDFTPERADHLDEPGMITSQIIQRVMNDQLVIADLTGRNPNVYYELSLRHALRKPLVQLIHKDETLPFDVQNMRTISYDHKDLDSVNTAKEDLKRQINLVKDKSPNEIETPFSVSIELQDLRSSDDSRDRNYGELLSVIMSLRSDLQKLAARVHKFDSVNKEFGYEYPPATSGSPFIPTDLSSASGTVHYVSPKDLLGPKYYGGGISSGNVYKINPDDHPPEEN